MEKNLAALIGKPYAARKVTFHLPDFVDITINAGDDRRESGATIGQSLPNWGPVANEGRGRTVAMSNLYSDPDSQKTRREGAESLLSKESIAEYADSSRPGLLTTILHEATHNLGPAHEYKFKGKTDSQWFGGPLASMMEELKAQSGALYYVEFLKKQGIIDEEMAKRTYTDSVVWAFGHIRGGMYTDRGGRKAYSQLAAIADGLLARRGRPHLGPEGAGRKREGRGRLHDSLRQASRRDRQAHENGGRPQGLGRPRGGRGAREEILDGSVIPQAVITERLLRNPRATFVYALSL